MIALNQSKRTSRLGFSCCRRQIDISRNEGGDAHSVLRSVQDRSDDKRNTNNGCNDPASSPIQHYIGVIVEVVKSPTKGFAPGCPDQHEKA